MSSFSEDEPEGEYTNDALKALASMSVLTDLWNSYNQVTATICVLRFLTRRSRSSVEQLRFQKENVGVARVRLQRLYCLVVPCLTMSPVVCSTNKQQTANLNCCSCVYFLMLCVCILIGVSCCYSLILNTAVSYMRMYMFLYMCIHRCSVRSQS
jgi:hypothetical protein